MANSKKYWFDKNVAKMNFAATLISGCALIVSIAVLIATTRENRKNYNLAKSQYESMLFYSKKQFNHSDSLFNLNLKLSNIKDAHQDTLILKQIAIFEQQSKTAHLQYLNQGKIYATTIDQENPIFSIRAYYMQNLSNGLKVDSIFIQFKNNGKRDVFNIVGLFVIVNLKDNSIVEKYSFKLYDDYWLNQATNQIKFPSLKHDLIDKSDIYIHIAMRYDDVVFKRTYTQRFYRELQFLDSEEFLLTIPTFTTKDSIDKILKNKLLMY